MALITLNTFSTTTINLNPNDRFYLGTAGNLTTVNSSVVFSPVSVGTVHLGIFGTIFSGGAATLVGNASFAGLTIGPQGVLSSINSIATFLSAANITATNAGTISTNSSVDPGLFIIQRVPADGLTAAVTNTGVISGGRGIQIEANSGTTSIANTGQIVGRQAAIHQPSMGSGLVSLILSNSGELIGHSDTLATVDAFSNVDVDNTGTIQSPKFIALNVSGTLNLSNSGTISGNGIAIQAGGTTSLHNEGKITGKIVTSAQEDGVINIGTISGSVEVGSGDDTVRNGGSIGGDIELGDGNDTYRGHNGHVANGVSGGGGTDFMRGGAGEDDFGGGTGNDDLRGGGGDDDLHGEDGNDSVRGGSGDDRIFGDKGSDSLRGGSGADDFIYLLKTDSTGKFFDTIADFQRGVDHIDLTAVGGRKFIGTSGFGGTAGEVRFKTIGTDAMVFVDLTGNKKPDMKILLDDIAQLSADDFLF